MRWKIYHSTIEMNVVVGLLQIQTTLSHLLSAVIEPPTRPDWASFHIILVPAETHSINPQHEFPFQHQQLS